MNLMGPLHKGTFSDDKFLVFIVFAQNNAQGRHGRRVRGGLERGPEMARNSPKSPVVSRLAVRLEGEPTVMAKASR